MAVKKGKFTDTEGEVTITNGDFQALREIAKDYKLDESDVITFAIGVLSRAKGKAIGFENEDGGVEKFVPADKLRKAE